MDAASFVNMVCRAWMHEQIVCESTAPALFLKRVNFLAG